VDVDNFWHYHILDTKKYAVDCHNVFGYFLHHFPYVGMRGEEDEQALHRMGDRMRTLYEETFGQDYLHHLPAHTPARPSRSAGLTLGAAYGGRTAGAERTAKEAAWCTRAMEQAVAETAWCTFTGPETVSAESAWCTKATEAAWCTKAPESAWCTKAAEQAWCTKAAEPAWCTKIEGQVSARETSEQGAVEDRVGFYLERPRLSAA
jgi:hypothetical protein